MMRSLTLAAILATAIAIPAIAQQGKTPDGRPIDPSGIQNKAPASPVAAAVQPGVGLKLTADEAKLWIDKKVYSSDDKKIGGVAAFARGTDNAVTEMHADIGGFLGLGETRVRVMPAQFTLQGDRVIVNVTAAQAKDLPKILK